MTKIKTYMLGLFVGISQLVNSMFGGNPNELLCARAYRTNNKLLIKVLDSIFFFNKDHCKNSYKFELNNDQLPEYKDIP